MKRAIVAGGGVFGVSAATALCSRGWDVELTDPGPLPRAEAASTDISKIVRMDYGADELYTELMERALPLWRAWNDTWGVPLYHHDGFLVLADRPLQPGGFEHDSWATLAARGHPVGRIGTSLASHFPAFAASRYPDGYFNAEAGWVESGRALSKMIDEAKRAGARFAAGEGISCLIEDDARVAGVVTTSGRRLHADVTLVAAGAWTPVLLPDLADRMWPVAQPVFHLRPDDPKPWRSPKFTVWAAAIATTGWYGFPANADGIVKIANHGPGRRVHPDDARVTTPDQHAALAAFLGESLPGLASAPVVSSKTCLYCDSFDGDFWIGRDPARPGVAVASGDSGHGFKFAPVLGEVIADAIEEKSTKFTDRFGFRTPAARAAEQARWGLS